MDYKNLREIFFKFDPETAHFMVEMAMRYLPEAFKILDAKLDDKRLNQEILGKIYQNPIGIGGGFDKNATMLKALYNLGFGHLEYGTFTPKPQDGNQKPRLFRLIEEESIQNAMGFNNEGCEKILQRVKKNYPFCIPLWANIGKNKLTPNENALSDYEKLVASFDGFCDVFVVNLSSPNTPNLRALQEVAFIKELFDSLKTISKKPILLKIAPDLDYDKAIEICKSAVESGASGLIISNTSIDYTLSRAKNLQNFGGLSGQVIKEKSRNIFKAVAGELFGETILVACGGIDDAKEAYERIKMGANLVQIFTSFIYKGPKICYDINKGILELLEKDGFSSLSEAVGVNLKKQG